MVNKILGENKVVIPTKKERQVFENLSTELLHQFVKAYKGNRSMEAYILAWSVIEQFMLPDLIKIIASNLKIKVPKNLADTHSAQLIKLYYFLSHDLELYNSLEKARKRRNKLVHSMHSHENWLQIKKGYKTGTSEDIKPLLVLFRDRFTGKTKIPVLNLYANGWNDMREETLKIIKEMSS